MSTTIETPPLITTEIQQPVPFKVVLASTPVITTVLGAGTQGLSGRDGIDGQDGAPGGIVYMHAQNVASDTWVIPHNLNKYPTVVVIDSSGRETEGETNYVDLNNVILRFTFAFAGNASLE